MSSGDGTRMCGRACDLMLSDEDFMRRAIAIAREAARSSGAAPIGCVIVREGTILAEGHNQTDEDHDPTAHAEIVVIRRACSRLSADDLRGATLYSTLQPCGMCSMASIWAKVRHIVFGAERHQVHEMYFEDRHFDTIDFIRDAFRDDISVRGGILAEDCADLYYKPGDQVPKDEQGNL
jgi:tRNA(adenine34) deaminase